MSIKVVLADDEQMVRSGLRLILEAEPDIEVVGEADDGGEALELTRRREIKERLGLGGDDAPCKEVLRGFAQQFTVAPIVTLTLGGLAPSRLTQRRRRPACSSSRPSTSTSTCTRASRQAPAAFCSSARRRPTSSPASASSPPATAWSRPRSRRA